MKIAVLFPGQGSQYLGMGKEFIAADSDCAEIMKKADIFYNYPLGQLINDGPSEKLSLAIHLQPAITVTNLICWCALRKALGDIQPVSCFAGHSIGEYAALYAAGVTSLEDTMRLISKRAWLMEREGRRFPSGGMRAIIGLSLGDIENIIAAYDGPGVVALVNHNTALQTIISESDDALDAISLIAVNRGARLVPLNIHSTNHSSLLAGAVPTFTRFLEEVEFRKPEYPIYFNVTAAPEYDGETIKMIMARQITSRGRWFELVTRMLADGVDTFIEVGPKTVLGGLVKKIMPKDSTCTVLQVDTPDTLAICISQLKGEGSNNLAGPSTDKMAFSRQFFKSTLDTRMPCNHTLSLRYRPTENSTLVNKEKTMKQHNNLMIRPMEIVDIAPIFHLGQKIFTVDTAPHLYHTWSETEVIGLYQNAQGHCYVAEVRKQIVGFVLGTVIKRTPPEINSGYLVWLLVCPEFARKGIAGRLCGSFSKAMIEEGVHTLIVDTEADNPLALQFFQKMGFGNFQEHIYLSMNLSVFQQNSKRQSCGVLKNNRYEAPRSLTIV